MAFTKKSKPHDADADATASPLTPETIDALVELRRSSDGDPLIPPGLPGAGKWRSKLTDEETGLLASTAVGRF